MDDENVYIMDVYNFDIYPHDRYAKRTLLPCCHPACLGWSNFSAPLLAEYR